jgi:hypothetical protein
MLLTAATGSCLAADSDTLFTTPIINISPPKIDFGAVRWKRSVVKSFVVANWGGGKLVGKATVRPPFKILSGGSYQLGPADVQVVTISYVPSGAPMDTNVVKFTGGGGALAPVTGKLSGKKPGED